MSIFDRIFGRSRAPRSDTGAGPAVPDLKAAQPSSGPENGDQRAIERYQYLLRTAAPDKIEQAHQEAFAQLTPQQRQEVLQSLSQASPNDRPQSDSAADLARSATRVEMQRPGTLIQVFNGPGMGMGGMGMGGMGMGMGGMLLGSVAGSFIGTAIAEEMFNDNNNYDNGSNDNDAGGNNDNDAQGSGDQQDGSAQDAGNDNSGGDQSSFADDGSAGYDNAGFDDGSAGYGDAGFDSGGFDGGGDFGGGNFG